MEIQKCSQCGKVRLKLIREWGEWYEPSELLKPTVKHDYTSQTCGKCKKPG